jgi:glycosyltransferase involved in cell wall biosynthesis
MSERKKILILFDGGHIAYSPTIAQLYNELEKDFEVTVFTQDPNDFSKNVQLPYRLEMYSMPGRISRLFYKIMYKFLLLFNDEAKQINKHLKGKHVDYFFRFLRIKKYVKQKKFDKIICVDLKNLFFVNTVLKTRSYFLSLELCNNENILPFVDFKLVDCVIIQSAIRYEYLLKQMKIRTFFIQNAPTFNRSLIKEKRAGHIYTGTAWDPFGFGYCLDYLKENPNERLTVLGAVKDKLINKNNEYKKLIVNKRLIITDKYIPDAAVVEFISSYEIGFCFYNFEHQWINNFNYLSAPSGKIFKYMAAGVPVICNKIIGFEFVDEFECGIRIDSFDPSTIRLAVEKIRADYDTYVNGALKAAAHFSFDKAVKPFIDFAKEDII